LSVAAFDKINEHIEDVAAMVSTCMHARDRSIQMKREARPVC
jgi:hypothetical protein